MENKRLDTERAVVEFLSILIAIRSVNGTNCEASIAKAVNEMARSLGLSTQAVTADEARPNILVTTSPGLPVFLILAHFDTVPARHTRGWYSNPFVAYEDGGRLYGRGAADNKAGIACGMAALSILEDRAEDGLPIGLLCVSDEESGASSRIGLKHCLERGIFERCEGAVYSYAGDGLAVGHRGVLRIRIRSFGEAIHSGSSAWQRQERGCNASTALAEALLAIETLGRKVWGQRGVVITPGTLLRGGETAGVVPAVATGVVDCRTPPGLENESVLASIRETVADVQKRRRRAKFDVTVQTDVPGVQLESSHWLVRLASQAYQSAFQVLPREKIAGPANETYLVIRAGVPCIAGLGPAGGNAHAVNEFVTVESLIPAAHMYAYLAEAIRTRAGA